MKKTIIILCIATILNACTERQAPDELKIVKYQKLELPQDFSSLPIPEKNKKSLGYQEAQKTALKTLNYKTTKNKNAEILTAFKIKKASKTIRIDVDSLPSEDIIVDAKKENERIKNNKKAKRKITDGRTPTKRLNKSKSGFDELFN